jgi:glycosyltransferase involved in cell wall biosynthesis
MLNNTQKTIVVMPAYNAASTLEETFRSIPSGWVDEAILVDDGSIDATVAIAKRLGITTVRHMHNAGYGANQKTCYTYALDHGADIIIMLHPDGQYNPGMIPEMIQCLEQDRADVVLGSRFLIKNGPRAGGMPLYKYLANRFLTTMENLSLGQNLSEFHTGYRGYQRKVLETIPFLRNSNDFVFDTQFLFQAFSFKFRVEEIAVDTRYFHEASSISFLNSVKYGLSTEWVAFRYLLHKIGIPSRLYLP